MDDLQAATNTARTQRNKPTVQPEEIAETLGLSLNSVYAGLRARELPGYRVGRRWIITRGAWNKFLAGDGIESGRAPA